MDDYDDERAERGLRRYVHAIASGFGLGLESLWCEVAAFVNAYLALEGRSPHVPEHDVALFWDERRAGQRASRPATPRT